MNKRSVLKNFLLNIQKLNNMTYTKIKNDINGNPRYVFHYLNFSNDYVRAVKLANKHLGGSVSTINNTVVVLWYSHTTLIPQLHG